jgi:hypothetical protein
MAKNKHTPNRRLQFLTDAFVTLGITALVLVVTGMAVSGPAFHASVYNPMPTQQETRFDRTYDNSGVSSPTSYTSCERRANKIRNHRRREQALVKCHYQGQ